MIKRLTALLLILLPAGAMAQAVQPGGWDLTSTVVDIAAAGAPAFLLRMARGKSKTEHKCVSPDQARAGIAALLAPNPKAQCRTENQRAADGHYAQSLICPQKNGEPIRVTRAGSYDANGFSGRVEMNGHTPKGALTIVMTQRAARVGGTCHG